MLVEKFSYSAAEIFLQTVVPLSPLQNFFRRNVISI